ncbi:MAG TPA: hypothetical protein PKZ54_09735 [Syntrophorhabdaceae bacterium]|nr:hypothetical protein [Syntrophorhabdaceae bacterium]
MDTSEHIETVFDYATPEEIEELGLENMTRETYLAIHAQNHDDIYIDLSCLFEGYRNDPVRGKFYADKIQDPQRKFWHNYQDIF